MSRPQDRGLVLMLQGLAVELEHASSTFDKLEKGERAASALPKKAVCCNPL